MNNLDWMISRALFQPLPFRDWLYGFAPDRMKTPSVVSTTGDCTETYDGIQLILSKEASSAI